MPPDRVLQRPEGADLDHPDCHPPSMRPRRDYQAGCCFLLLLHARRLALQLAQEVELRAADLRGAEHVDLVDDRRVQREDALDALAERHLAHREGRARAAAVHADHHALEHLDAFLVAFTHLHVDADGVAGLDRRALRQLARSTVSTAFMTLLPSLVAPTTLPAAGARSSALNVRRVVEQVRPPFERALQRLAPPPSLDLRVVPRQQHRRNPQAAGTPRAACTAENPATRARTCRAPPTLRRRRRPARAARPHRRSPAPATRRPTARSRRSRSSRSPGAAARARRPLRTARTASRRAIQLAQPLARPRASTARRPARSADHRRRASPPLAVRMCSTAREQRLRLQHHARPAAERHVVDDAMPVRREIAQVVHADVQQPARRSRARQSLPPAAPPPSSERW